MRERTASEHVAREMLRMLSGRPVLAVCGQIAAYPSGIVAGRRCDGAYFFGGPFDGRSVARTFSPSHSGPLERRGAARVLEPFRSVRRPGEEASDRTQPGGRSTRCRAARPNTEIDVLPTAKAPEARGERQRRPCSRKVRRFSNVRTPFHSRRALSQTSSYLPQAQVGSHAPSAPCCESMWSRFASTAGAKDW